MAKKSILPLKKDNFLRNIGIGLLLLLTILSIIGLYGRPLKTEEESSLSRIVQEINSNNVADIKVSQEELTVSLKNSDTKLTARKESDTSITETLRNLGVTEQQLASISLTVTKPTGFSFWAGALLPILLPFLLLGGFLWFMMRSAQNASSQAMSFGQMRSRPLEVNKKKRTTFADVAGSDARAIKAPNPMKSHAPRFFHRSAFIVSVVSI